MAKLKASDVNEAAGRFQSALSQFGADNQATLRAEIAYRETKDRYEYQQRLTAELRELKADMKARGIPRRSMMNGGHTTESMRANAQCFALETQLGNLTR